MGKARLVGGCGPWTDARGVELSNEIVRRFLQGREVRVLQIVTTKVSEGTYKITTMGLGDKGRGETLGSFEGTIGEVWAHFAALIKLLEVPK